ncbi:PapD-like protein [Phascolomyces articulosus]|uniref:PapD-like protein n=1 Tax=Phascolomyces articulosus TaxID=60185 RepID=A0AAD5PB15_9FUNG|nr:PapD-like protein [Phascolomyces articulosus]
MALILEPDRVLPFERPLGRVIKQNVTLRNPSGEVVAFKVKTTSPNVYSVRPNVGFIGPSGTAQILADIHVPIILVYRQPQPVEPRICKDKFLILSIAVNDPNIKTTEEIHAMWTNVEPNNRANIFQAKLLCQFVESQNANIQTPRQQPQPTTSLQEPQPVLDIHQRPEIGTVSLPSLPDPALTNPQPMVAQFILPQPTEPTPPPPLRERPANIISPHMPPQSTPPLPEPARNDEQISELNETIHQLKEQLNVYRDEVSSLRQRRSEPKQNPQPLASNRVQPVGTRYPASVLVLVALFAFALGYLVIRATS